MAVRKPMYYDSGSLKEMTTAMVNQIVDQTVYQYSLSPSVALSVVSSGGSLGALADTRLQAGAVSTSNTAFPNEATTAEPTTVTVNFAKITSADASVSPTADTGKTWPAYLTSYENLILHSQEFDQSGWYSGRLTLTDDATTAPDGTTTAWKCQQVSGQTASGYIQRGLTVVSGKTYTLSIFVKAGTNRDYMMIRDTVSDGTIKHTSFNVGAGTLGTVNGGHTAAISNAGNGWYRCSITFTSDGNRSGSCPFYVTDTNGTTTVTDNEGFNYMWGAQFEEASFATSYIPTTTTAKSAGGDLKSMSLADIKDTFLHPAIDLLVSGSTGTQQGGTYHISTATSVGGSTEVSGSNTPIFTDTRADTSLYSAAGIPEALDQPTTISNYYLHKITGSDTSYTLPVFTTATNQTQSYPEATFESLLQEWIRYTAASSGDGYEINYSYTTGTNRGSGMGDTTLNGTGDYQTLQVGDDYRAQEFPNGTAVTTNTYYLKINKS